MTLFTHTFGPARDDLLAGTPTVLAIHGLTGHGDRWRFLAADLPEVRIVAPDLRGHGQSPFTPPWSFEANLDGLEEVVVKEDPSDLVIVGHSFGGALAMRLAHRLATSPVRVRAIIALDPAQGLDPQRALEVSTASLENWDYADAEAARSAKCAEGWALVPGHILDHEIETHLVPNAAGRVQWRVGAPAAATAWSEMSRPAVQPPAGIPTTIVVADRVDPPFISERFIADCGPDVTVLHADCEHMVPFLEPVLVARLIREAIW
ncbi:alpha/beta fold hydrolase [Gordonia amarae]|uniref:Alpha/beta fold hydrolase n=2 Tax=Gordonia amarae TaxID=36821 RepID=A0A857MIR3_9ACTN|nr:alpha/beta fold hydrolase [Gordonia amarae]MCS3880153.1 lipase [Gordonia amarae]QHN18519.1 alpha/beta fold hydrolase [Gordonia amarae]QHN23002.1 alpha/beta fold hydrolase [Gordonia amarae]QHN31903.1 alpha/beta fold hydrolase [Gordonia amarae]QHN40650.1 alpha/beta fold hydrolase [Gordonia amarae]